MSDPIIPSAEELAKTRREHWHQAGEALVTMESALPWLQSVGLVLFAPRTQQISAPAPTLVEATLGAPNAAPSVAERETARALLQRMVSDGTALPLNLLGAVTTTPDEPDFVVSAAAFPYLFTLRGDKAWKQLPEATGPFKVSPLAVNTYTFLAEGGPRTVADLAVELGKGLTETAVLRALSELWQHLRVFPVGQPDGSTTWELASARFTKAIKAGANAGQPTALSALITLYLGQAMLASEDDVEVFLSPLAPRSRVRDVLHALIAARELQTMVVEGKHLLYVEGDLPAFAADAPAPERSPLIEQGESRIAKFKSSPRPAAAAGRPAGRPRPATGGDRERRPFKKPGQFSRPVREPAAKRAFDRPWDEEKQDRMARQSEQAEPGAENAGEFLNIDLDAGQPERPRRTEATAATRSKPFGKPKGAFKSRAGAPGNRPRESRPDRPSSRFGGGGDRPAYGRPREGGGDREFRPRKTSEFGDRPRRGDGGAGEGRPPRRFGSDRPSDDRGAKFRGESSGSRPFRGRSDERGAGRGAPGRPSTGGYQRTSFADRNRSGEAGGADRREGGAGERTFRPRGDRGDRPTGERSFRPGADRGSRPSGERGFRPAGERSGRPAGERSYRAGGDRPGGDRPTKRFGGKPEGFATGRGGAARDRPSAGGKGKPAARAGARPAGEGPFDKFKGGNKPWGKRPPARKIKPEEDNA